MKASTNTLDQKGLKEAKELMKSMTYIYNTNLNYLRIQANSVELSDLKNEYKASTLNHLAKILMLRGISLINK